MSVFGSGYAEAYDALYSDKDFAAEAKVITSIISERLDFSQERQTLLDFGCGTGNHTKHLKDNFGVVGVDLSLDMLKVARDKNPDVDVYLGDVRTIGLGKEFDVVMMMFAVLGYQNNNDDILQTLRNVKRHLVPGGLFIFDVWHGPGVLLNRPSVRIKEATVNGKHFIRQITPVLCAERNLCRCDYRLWTLKDGQVYHNSESHMMRYFFPLEMQLFLETAGFSLLSYTKSGSSQLVEDTDWTIMFVCKSKLQEQL